MFRREAKMQGGFGSGNFRQNQDWVGQGIL